MTISRATVTRQVTVQKPVTNNALGPANSEQSRILVTHARLNPKGPVHSEGDTPRRFKSSGQVTMTHPNSLNKAIRY